ncbi:MAG: hypothetical protein ACYC44_02540 [Patescibacteria group bacterium]
MNWKILLCVFAALFTAACGGRSESIIEVLPADGGGLPCIPGAQVACACMEGVKGYQICKASGHEFYPCECPSITEDAGHDVVTADVQNDADAQVEAEADAQLDADAGADADAASDTLVEAESDAEAGSDADTAADSGTLSVTLASNPVSSPVVKKTQNAEALGIKATAAGGDMMIKSIPLRCQASINGAAYTSADCWKRVTSLAIFDGDTQVGYATSPNTDGKAPILPNYLVAKGVTKDLTVKASFASTASLTEPNDKVSIGIDGDVIAVDTIYNQDVKADVSATLSSTQLSQTPIVVITILPSGTLTIVADGHPSSQIVIAGKDVWVPFARYKAMAQYEDMKTDLIRAKNLDGGDNADFVQVAIASSGVVKGINVFQAGVTGSTDLYLSGNELTVPKDGYVSFEIWAKLAPVVPSSLVNGAWQGVARSGHAPRLGLDKNFQTGEWDAKYTGKLNVQTTGLVSGERVYADMGAEDGNRMVLREAKPYFTKHNPVNTVLMPGIEQEHYKWQIGADGTIAWKQIMFHVESSSLVSFANYRLYKNSTQMPSAEYSIMDTASGQDLKTISWSPTYGNLVISFKDEQTVTGSGEIYTLRATCSGPGAGQSVMIKPMASPSNELITGEVKDNTWAGFNAQQDLFVVQAGYTAIGYFVWSDLSEVPHSAQPLPSSKDWTTAWLVEDLTQATTLTN